ncbi:structural maintenance of chromosomes protein 5 [Nematocida homosporus]|uniref:structural maintenance of chromosomes protein 5 n=1 Tax=Nematocida homosporus TaxID=1912981 RepID=UPI00221ED0BF|nr:structural maintenance of chromosomes protein 5 [Nematocida homosporus]KAI5184561.1 structural maintenance of chromosomes protein 5 [Nematocida homosporus]
MLQAHLYSLRLIDFQKYADATFIFSKQGNLIVGANGSGKSTVAAAIALALGGNTKTIGKNTPVHELIKFGSLKSILDLTIHHYTSEDSTDPVPIRVIRTITPNSSTFKINDRIATNNEVKELAISLGIRIENLGQFLPQDRVTEFALLSAEEQLELTLQTCAPDLLKNKKTLESADDLLLVQQKRTKLQVHEIEQKERRLQFLEEESQKLRELLARKENLKYIQGKLVWTEYATLKTEYDKLRAQKEALQAEYTTARAKYDKEESIYHQDLSKHDSSMRTPLEALMNAAQFSTIAAQLRTLDQKTSEVEERIQAVLQRKDSLLQEKAKVRAWMDNTKEVKPPQPKFTTDQVAELEQLEHEIRHYKIKDSEWQVQTAVKATEMRNVELALKQEQEKESLAMERLKRMHLDTYTAVTLIKQDKRQWKVDLPAFLTMTITKEEFTDEVASQLSLHALTAFVCHNQEEFHEFIAEFKERRHLAINIVEKQPDTQQVPVGPYLSPEYGMVYLSECISAPEAIVEFLNIFSKLACIPVTKQSINEPEFFKAHPKLFRAIANKRVIEIKRSKYTSDAPLAIYPMPKGIDVTNKKADSTLKEKLEVLRAERETRRLEREKMHHQKDQLEARLKLLKEIKEADLHRQATYERQRNTLESLRQREAQIDSEFTDFEGQEQVENQYLLDFKAEAKHIWTQLTPFDFLPAFESFAAYAKQTHAETERLRAQSLALAHSQDVLHGLHQQLTLCQSSFTTHERTTKSKMKEAETVLIVNTPEIKERLKALPSDLPTLRQMLEEEKARIELSVAEPDSIMEYERFKEELAALQRQLDRTKKEEQYSLTQKRSQESQLKQEITTIIEQIDQYAQVLFPLAGVRASIAPDFPSSPRRWQLQFKVQFRAEEKLEVLSSGRQSGGEKCVSIILYLLSMQRLTPSPFVLVDEINQGMDVHHERTIHSILLGRNSAREGQTIVITPKLVSQLEYAVQTKVHVIVELPGG